MLRTIIIDNDSKSIEYLKILLSKLNDFEILDTFSNPFEALKTVLSDDVHIIFIELDIPNFNGFEFIRNLPEGVQVVVVSRVREYAIEAFELEVLDYLIKPLVQARFLKTASRIFKNTNHLTHNVNIDRSYVYVKVEKKMVKIYHDQILFVESVGDYIKIVCKGESFVSNGTLKGFTLELPNDQFLRIHRSYTISIPRVTALEGNTVEIGDNKIPVGRQYLSETKSRIIS
jgi:DNA-binding LytR/AlgR family response regulator